MRAALAIALALASCDKPTTTTPDGDAKAPPAPDAQRASSTCETPRSHDTLSWVPPTATRLALFDLADPALDAALAHLAKLAREPNHGLPITTAFSIANWVTELPILRGTLRSLDMAPPALAHVEVAGTTAWLWPASCDVRRLEAQLAGPKRLRFRTGPSFVVASGIDDDARAAFPFELVVVHDWVALVRLDKGAAFADAAQRERQQQDPPALVEAMTSIEPAPVRVLVRAGGLVDPASATVGTEHALRATKDGAGRVEPPAAQ
jgi:hypothetical protein